MPAWLTLYTEHARMMKQGCVTLPLAAQFEGRHMRVDRAAERSKSIHGGGTHVLYEPNRSVFVGNLPFDIQVCPLLLHETGIASA